MTQPEPAEVTAIGGSHPGSKSIHEIESNISLTVDNGKSIDKVAGQIISAADWHLSTITDPNKSPKYAVDPNMSFYGSGSLSLLPRLGKLIFASNINEANRGAFSVDQSGSSFYSSMSNTTLGSLKIDTVDGYEANPVSPVNPSTNYSPTKPWIRKLFPALGNSLMTIAILELVQYTLLKLFNDRVAPKSENFESKEVDMGLIIVDNQNIEDELFRSL